MNALRECVRCTRAGLPSRRMSTFLPSPKTLDDIMKVQNLEDMQPDDIEALWMEVSPPFVALPPQLQCRPTRGLTLVLLQYHSDETRNRAGSVMSAEEYRLLQFRAAAAPLFVLPLGKGEGRSLSMLLQWQLPHCLITELDHYKRCALRPIMTAPASPGAELILSCVQDMPPC